MARNLEVHTGLLHYCTIGLEAANDTQNDSVDTARGKIMTSRIYQNDNVISQRATYITKSLQMPEDTT